MSDTAPVSLPVAILAGGLATRLHPITRTIPKAMVEVAGEPFAHHQLRLLARHGLKVDDIDLWELNEAFASQCLYSRDKLGIDPAKYNVNGGSISIGHPYGVTGARCTGHLLLEGKRRKAKYGVVTMCIGGGQGAAGLFEIFN